MITIRKERPEDELQIETIARDAFWNLYFPGCHEHFVIHQLRAHPDFLRELSWVIEVDGTLVGAIFYTTSHIQMNDRCLDTITFGPVFIDPRYHRQGLGRRLITHSIQHATELGYRAILTLGYAYHYEPYGFKSGKHYNIAMPDGHYYKGLLVLPLYEGALDQVEGIALFTPALDVGQEEVDVFDATFPPKEKRIMPSQQEYVRAVAEREDGDVGS